MAFATQSRRAAHRLQRLLASLDDSMPPAQVHALRAGARHLEAVLELMQAADTGGSHRLRKALRRVRRRAGAVRDLDVVIDRLNSLDVPGNHGPLDAFRSRLNRKRERAARKLLSAVEQERKPLLARLATLQATLAPPVSRKMQAIWGRQAKAQASADEQALAAWPPMRSAELHAFRIRVKHLRDTLQLDAGSHRPLLSAATALKDTLGEWHDWQVLLELSRSQKKTAAAPFARQILRQEQKHHATALHAARSFQQSLRQEARGRRRPSATG